MPRDRGQHAIVRGRLQPTVGTARLIPVAAESIGRGGHAANSLQQNPSEGHLRDQSPLIINCLRDNGPQITNETKWKTNAGQLNKAEVTGVLSGLQGQSRFLFNLHMVKIDFLRLIQIYDTSGDI